VPPGTTTIGRWRLNPTVRHAADSVLERTDVVAVPSAHVRGSVFAAYLALSDGTTMPELAAMPHRG